MARLILIADDSPIIQRKAQRILQDEGFEVQTVSNGVAAVKKLPLMQPVLVLADVSMPGKDGYEVCEFVKTSAGLRHVPVLLVGSDLEPYDEQRGARVQADGIIKKPFAPHDLISVVRRFTTPAQAPASPPAREEAPETSPDEIEESILPPQLVDLTAPEVALAPNPVFAEPISEPFPSFAPEPDLIAAETNRQVEESNTQQLGELISSPQLVDLTAPEVLPEPASPIAEPTPEPATEILQETAAVGPEAARAGEESNLIPPPFDASTSPEAAPEPTQVAAAPAPEFVHDTAPGSTSTSPVASQEWGDVISGPSALETSAAPDAEWVHKVVHRVVTRMAPPVLAPEQVEELARTLTREIMLEFGGCGGQTDFPIEGPSPD
ncbi:MAG: response regulator [Terriglobia bacterium]